MMLGVLLARAGVDVLVLEKHKDFLRDFRGDTIHPSTLRLMEELGWLDDFLKLPHQEVKRLYGQFAASQADYLLLHVANLRNIEDLVKLKPPGKTIVFWDFDDRMYLVHKDLSDRLWGTGALSEFGRRLRYHLR